jgi:hypothetical protein
VRVRWLAILLVALCFLVPVVALAAEPVGWVSVPATVSAPLPAPVVALDPRNGPQTTVTEWSSGIGLAPCVGSAFAAEHARLPFDLDELTGWGAATGRRQADGIWVCR